MPTPTDSERATPQADLAARRDYSVRRPTFDVWPLLLVVVLAVLSGLLVLALMQYQRTVRLRCTCSGISLVRLRGLPDGASGPSCLSSQPSVQQIACS